MTPDLLCLQGRHSQPGEGWGWLTPCLCILQGEQKGSLLPCLGSRRRCRFVLTVLFGLAGHLARRGHTEGTAVDR